MNDYSYHDALVAMGTLTVSQPCRMCRELGVLFPALIEQRAGRWVDSVTGEIHEHSFGYPHERTEER